MKKYFVAIATLALLAACNGKSAKESTVTADTVSPGAVVEAQPENPVDMRDSLKTDSADGPVVRKEYKGTIPAADGPGIVYDLTLYYQEKGKEGVYRMNATYLQADNGNDQTFTTTGKQRIKKGIPGNANATVYELLPSDGSVSFYFLVEDNSLTMLNQDLEKASSGLNYTLKEVQSN